LHQILIIIIINIIIIMFTWVEVNVKQTKKVQNG